MLQQLTVFSVTRPTKAVSEFSCVPCHAVQQIMSTPCYQKQVRYSHACNKNKVFFGPNESSENLIEDSLDSGQPGPVSSMQMMAFLVFLTDSVMVIVKNWINFAKEYCTNYEIKHVSEKVSN